MAKREKSNKYYSSVVGGGIYNHYGILLWRECFFCSKEFRRENGYRFQMQMNLPWVYSSAECSSSKEAVNDNVKRFKSNRSKAPAAPPRKP